MNEKLYLTNLAKHLTKLNEKERADIIRDFEEYFESGRQEGKTVDEIIDGLGTPETLAEELLAAYSEEDFVEQVMVSSREESSTVKNVVAKIDGANFIILPTDQDKPYVEVKDNDERTEVDVNVVGDTLYVKINRRDVVKRFLFITFIGNFSNSDTTLYLPKKLYESINVYNDDGFVKVVETHANSFQLETDNGRIIADKLVGQLLTCETDNGRIQLHDIVFKQVKAQTDNGRIIAENVKAELNHFETDNGRIEMKQIQGVINAETDNGRIEASLTEVTGHSSLKTDNGSIFIVSPEKLKDVLIEASTNWGSCSIYEENVKTYSQGSLTARLKLRTSNGKIQVVSEAFATNSN